MIKKERGITLIALVITIIVMLILVIVTINVAVNGNLFKNAKEASAEMQKQADREELYIAIAAAYNEKTGLVDFDRLKQELGDRWEADGDSLPCVFTKIETGNSFVVYEDGTISDAENTKTDFDVQLTILEKLENSTRVKLTADTSKLVSKEEMYNKLNQLLGIEGENIPSSQTVTTIYTMLKSTEKSYDDVKSELSTTYNKENPTDDELILMVIYGENYSNYTLADVVGSVDYEATNKSINVYKEDGTEVSYSNLEWDGNDAIFTVTEYGNLTVKVDFDGKKAVGHIRVSHVDPVGDFTYEYDEEHKTAMISGLSETGLAKLQNGPIELPIPETVIHDDEEYRVIGIKPGAFSHQSNLIITSLPDGITSIGANAFYGCTNLALTSLPDSITSIGENAFEGCTNLALEELPDSVESIGRYAFYGCTSLALSELPDNVTSIGTFAFSGCNNITLTSLPDNLTTIEPHTFVGCINMALTELPDGITEIQDYAFSGCWNLDLTELPEGLTRIGSNAFSDCYSLSLTELPDNLTYIGPSAFAGCRSLALTELPEGIKIIYAHAFNGCTNINITTLNLSTINLYGFRGCTGLTQLEINSSVASIGDNAFEGAGLTKLEITANSISIGKDAFKNSSLTDIYFPNISSQPSSGLNTNWKRDCNATIHWGEPMP